MSQDLFSVWGHLISSQFCFSVAMFGSLVVICNGKQSLREAVFLKWKQTGLLVPTPQIT